MFIDTCVAVCVMMFVHKSNPNYLAKCLTHVKCMYLLKCHKVNMILI